MQEHLFGLFVGAYPEIGGIYRENPQAIEHYLLNGNDTSKINCLWVDIKLTKAD